MFSLNSLTENTISFKQYEEKILELSKKIGSCTMKEQFEKLDTQIFESMNKKIFRNKGLRNIDIKTLLAEVNVSRHVYLINKEELEKIEDKNNIVYILAKQRLEKGKKTIYFLDELVQLKGYGKFSAGVVDLMLKYIVNNSYRKTAKIINDITGLNISGSAVWNVIQDIALKIKEKENYEKEQYEEGILKYKNIEKNVIFSELDGVYITLQGKDKKEAIENYKINNPDVKEIPKGVRKKEIKVISVYEGFLKVAKGKNKLINKKVFAQMDNIINIKERSRIYIEKTYNMSKLKMIILNSDGGTWTKEKSKGIAFYQMDMHHIKDMIARNIREKEDIEKLYKMLKENKYEEMLTFAESLKYAYDGEVSEIEKIDKLKEYIDKNKKDFPRYQDSELFKKGKEKGNWYKNLGTQEATNYQVITSRMKRRRMSFSKAGADNLSRILSMVLSYDYKGIENELNVQTIPVDIKKESEEEIEYQKLLMNKYKYKKAKNSKYNDSFRGTIPGIEYLRTDEMCKIREIIY
ncbi:MAG: UPF0236 family protein [Bacilli bacterium]